MLRKTANLWCALGALTLCSIATAQPRAGGGEQRRQAKADAGVALKQAWADEIHWRSIGPAAMGGRITDIAVAPSDHNVIYVATASGGLLKTTNRGATWEHLFTDQSLASIGDVEVAPDDPDVVWVGTGEENPRNSVSFGDGVYKSEDGGRTWTHMGLERSFQIGDIVIHPRNHDVVYVAALGRLYGPNEERGLYRTKDGGKTWEKILYIDDRTGVIDIALKPDDPDVILAATYERQRDGFDTNEPFKKWGPGGGLWRSTDGGDNWTRIEDGLPTVQLGRIGIDWHVKDPNIVYAIVESELIGSGPAEAEPPTASLGLESVDADAGARITKVVKDGPADKAGLREGDIVIAIGGRRIVTQRGLHKALYDYEPGQRVKLDIVRDRKITTVELTLGKRPAEEAKEEQAEETKEEEEEAPRPGSDADIASRPYGTRLGGQRMNIQDEQGEEGFQYGGVYRSDDAGLTWRRVNSNNPRPMYFSLIRVDPNDPNYVFVGGVSLYWSDDGGKTFHDDGVQSEDGGSTHVDHHAMWVDPDDGRHILLGNDGGLYETFDRMKTWIHHNKFAIGQYYHVGVDTQPVYNVYGGLQDNGSWGGPSRVRNDRGPINEDWFRVGGGDGFIVFVDPEDPNLVYYESQNGFIARRDLRTGESAFLRPSPPKEKKYRWNWKTPFLLSHHNPKIYYAAGNYVFKSLYKGDNLEPISDEITLTDRGSATALAESPLDPDVLYVGTDDGALWATRDGGDTWTDLLKVTREDIRKARAKERKKAPKATSPDDPVTGRWEARMRSEQLPGSPRFDLVLTMDKEGAVTGTAEARIFSGEITSGSFDKDSGELSLKARSDQGEFEINATIEGQSMSGEIVAGEAGFVMPFEATKAAAEDAEEEEAAGGPKPLSELIPGPRWVSSIEASRYEKGRVYLTLDGHRSDDDAAYVFVSEDYGLSWTPISEGLGTVWARVIREDIENPNVLYLGLESGAMVSADRGKTWVSMGDLPTVPVHDFAQHPTAGEIVAATHGRSLWIADVSALRQLTGEKARAKAALLAPRPFYRLAREPSRGSGSLSRFFGDNGDTLSIFYFLGKDARSVSLRITDLDGELVRELAVATDAGLHRVDWDVRGQARQVTRRGRTFTIPGQPVAPGRYRLTLTVDGETYRQDLVVRADPKHPDAFGASQEEALEALEADPDG